MKLVFALLLLSSPVFAASNIQCDLLNHETGKKISGGKVTLDRHAPALTVWENGYILSLIGAKFIFAPNSEVVFDRPQECSQTLKDFGDGLTVSLLKCDSTQENGKHIQLNAQFWFNVNERKGAYDGWITREGQNDNAEDYFARSFNNCVRTDL